MRRTNVSSKIRPGSKIRAHAGKRPNREKVARVSHFLSHRNLTLILCFLLAAATVILYIPVVGNPFLVLDDHDYVTANSHIRGGLAWTTIRWAFTSTAAANWHPLTWLSHALDYQFFALHPAGHHLDSLLLHALNAVLLFLLLVWITKRIGPSLLVGALFAVHPINVESVAWVAERKNVLCTLFFLLAIAAYVRYAQKPDWRRYLLVAALFAAGLMAKPMVITLPFVLLLIDYWPLGRTPGSPPSAVGALPTNLRTLFLEKIPLLLLSAGSALVTLKVQRAGMAVRNLHQFPLMVRVENAIVAYGLYLWKMLWPARLALYPHSALPLPVWQWIVSAIVLLAITALVLAFRRVRYLAVGWFWFLGALVPVIGLVQVGEASMADRYAYIPLIGIFVIIAFGLSDSADAFRIRRAWVMIPVGCALLALALLTHRQIGYWASDYDLWLHTLAIAENPFAHDALGSVLLDPDLALTPEILRNLDTPQKRLDAARQQFQRALELRRQPALRNPSVYLPDIATTLNNLGNLDRLENRTDDARQHYEEALQIHLQLARQNQEPFPPDLATTLNNLATLEKSTSQWDDARQHFVEALKIYRQSADRDPDAYLPKVAEVLNSLAFVERNQKHPQEALQHYEEALSIRRQLNRQDTDAYLPYLALTLNDLGILQAMRNRPNEARRHYEEALRYYRQLAQMDPDTYLPYLAATLNNLALVEETGNQIEESRLHFEEDLSLYRQLSAADPARHSGDVARIQASLAELDRKK